MKVSAEEFKKRLDEKFGGDIVFDEDDFKGMNTKMDFWCKKHNEGIRRIPKSMLKTKGCRQCKLEQWERAGFDEFLKRARDVHGDRFEYFENEFVSFREHAKIKCNKHNEIFYQSPTKHLLSQGGCPSCKLETIAGHHRFSQEDFLSRAGEAHGDKYDYHAAEYVNVDTEVKIWCKRHKQYFWQTPYNHVNLQSNCPLCVKEDAGSWGRKGVYKTDAPSHLYILQLNDGCDDFIKIGLSVTPNRRIRDIPRKIKGVQSVRPICIFKGPADKLSRIESFLLWGCGLKRFRKEEWSWPGFSECFPVSELNSIMKIINDKLKEI